jgi:hypothetical protein
MLNKISLTQQILDQLKWEINPTLDQALQEWWKNPDEHAGLRLTAEGFFVFGQLEIAHYEFDVPRSIAPSSNDKPIANHDSTNGHFTHFASLLGKLNGLGHPL